MTTKTTASMTRTVSAFGPLQIAITILVAATALDHLFLGASLTMTLLGPTPQAAGIAEPMAAILAALFLCNFGGYVVLTAALYLPPLRRFQHVTRVLLIGYTALTFVAYFVVRESNWLNPVGLADKAIEAVLIALLVIEARRAHALPGAGPRGRHSDATFEVVGRNPRRT
jgi:hypothetical protein